MKHINNKKKKWIKQTNKLTNECLSVKKQDMCIRVIGICTDSLDKHWRSLWFDELGFCFWYEGCNWLLIGHRILCQFLLGQVSECSKVTTLKGLCQCNTWVGQGFHRNSIFITIIKNLFSSNAMNTPVKMTWRKMRTKSVI